MELFLLSNGKLADDAPLLGYAQPQLHAMTARRAIRSAVLIPYAIIRGDQQQRAAELSASLGIQVERVQAFASPAEAIAQAELILVSGGNTWFLNQMLHEQGLIGAIQRGAGAAGTLCRLERRLQRGDALNPYHERYAGAQQRGAACAGTLSGAD